MIAVGSETGVVKLFNLKSQKVSKQWGTMSADREILSMTFGSDGASIFAGLKNGSIELSNFNGELLKSYSMLNSTLNPGEKQAPVTAITLLNENRYLLNLCSRLILILMTEDFSLVAKMAT
jgi:WD40 repeat protein